MKVSLNSKMQVRFPVWLVNVLSVLSGNTSKSCRSPVVGEPRAHMKGGESKQRKDQ